MKYVVTMISDEGVVAITCTEQQVDAVCLAVQGVIDQLSVDVAFITVEPEENVHVALAFADFAQHTASTN